jgi:hypothetical protein
VAKAVAFKINTQASPAEVSGLGAGTYWVDVGSYAFPTVELNVSKSPASGWCLAPAA